MGFAFQRLRTHVKTINSTNDHRSKGSKQRKMVKEKTSGGGKKKEDAGGGKKYVLWQGWLKANMVVGICFPCLSSE